MSDPTLNETVPPLTLAELQAKVHYMEATVASLIAFTAAVVESHPQKDILMTRWVNAVEPSLIQFATLGPVHQHQGGFVPGWVEKHCSLKKG